MHSKENFQFRILYFIGIILVLCGHTKGGGIILDNWFHSKTFHLGLFAFGSGYFFYKHLKDRPLDIIKYKFKKTIVPLYIWTFIYGIIIQILHQFGYKLGLGLSLKNLLWTPLYSGHAYVFNLGSWFLVPLFLLQAFTAILIPVLKRTNGSIFIFILYMILGMIGIQLSFSLKNVQWLLLLHFLYFLPFFGLGILYKNKLEKIDKVDNVIYFAIIFTIKLFIIYFTGKLTHYDPANMQRFENFYLPYINGFLGIAFWLRVSKILVPSLKNSKIVNIISKNTFAIMMHHMVGLFLVNCCWLLLATNFNFIEGFSIKRFNSELFYTYNPKNLSQFNIIYLISGIIVSLLINKVTIIIKNKVKKIYINKS